MTDLQESNMARLWRSRRMFNAFRCSAWLIVGFAVIALWLLLTGRNTLNFGYRFLDIFLGIGIGITGFFAAVFILLGMFVYLFRWDKSSSKLGWTFVFLFFGFFGSALYFFTVYRKQVFQRGILESKSSVGSGLTINVASALCYLGSFIAGSILLLPVKYRENASIRFHAFQSMLLGLCYLVSFPAFIYVMKQRSSFFLEFVINIVWVSYFWGFIILTAYLACKAYNESTVVLPIIGPLALKFAGKKDIL